MQGTCQIGSLLYLDVGVGFDFDLDFYFDLDSDLDSGGRLI
jgi:hypothetical protein